MCGRLTFSKYWVRFDFSFSFFPLTVLVSPTGRAASCLGHNFGLSLVAPV